MKAGEPRCRPLLKLFIRMMLPVVTLAGFGGYASIVAISLNEGKTISATYSPDGEYRARIMQVDGIAGCARSTSFVVLVERRWHYLRTGSVEPFCFAGSSSQLAVKWTGPAALAIDCMDCDPNSTFTYDHNWGRLHFAFDLQRQAER